ncbi:MAG: cell division protein FtsL [Deltaproteobacteria bacterium]|nr:cell division protein FtsL [Deltaproteobacteria bacterium]
MVTRTHDGHALAAGRVRPGGSALVAAGAGTHLVAAVLVLVSVLFLAWVRVGSLHLGYELGRLRNEQDALMQESRALQLEMGTLRSPAELSRMARALGMVPPQAASVVSPPEGGTP